VKRQLVALRIIGRPVAAVVGCDAPGQSWWHRLPACAVFSDYPLVPKFGLGTRIGIERVLRAPAEAGDKAGQAAEDDGVGATSMAALHGSRFKVQSSKFKV
jgi:hypothetical protein